MFVGHALLAFALVAGAAAARGTDSTRAFALGAVAAAFAAAPDVDMAYALVGVVGAQTTDALAVASQFWQTGNLVHRAMTHSVVVAPVVAVAAGLWVRGRRLGRWREMVAAAGLLASVVAVSGVVSSGLGATIMLLFAIVVVAVAEATERWTDLGPTATFSTALVGLVSHPFGDLFTGSPPVMFYPFEFTVFPDRLALSGESTLNLLGAFGLELLTIWVGLLVALYLSGYSFRDAIDGRAALGAAYAVSVLLIPAPTLELSYPFVFSILAVGMVGVAPRVEIRRRRVELPDRVAALCTGLAAVSVAGFAYTVAYLVA
ncbi:hydrolase [Haloprofundus marisrubri]|uniref:Hydrolase n=1 Tax=Haloprofundus marisrubri TaxID=1514971 RepID=A0A0W1R589_9EURY|nr:metal-dependent hydrolase [Haloprofundus marisrubri]KTG08547.1 hydrolase [Haloprofundus marisrubri]